VSPLSNSITINQHPEVENQISVQPRALSNSISTLEFLSNEALDAFCAGNGTDGLSWETAHILENFVIDPPNLVSGIILRDISRFLLIRNCTIFPSIGYYIGSEESGILMENCQNINISSCFIQYFKFGVNIENCDEITINSTTIDLFSFIPGGVALYLYNSHNCTILKNDLFSEGKTVFLFHSENNIIQENDISALRNGIFLERSPANHILTNEISTLDFSINLVYSNFNYIYQNSLESEFGITLTQSDWNLISTNVIDTEKYCIHLDVAEYNDIVANILTAFMSFEIYIYGSRYNTFSLNDMTNYGFGFDLSLENPQNIDSSNTLNGKMVIYHYNGDSVTVQDQTLGQLILLECRNSLIKNISVNSIAYGISLLYCENSSISKCFLSYNIQAGIFLYGGSHNLIRESVFTENGAGILLTYSTNNEISNNSFQNNNKGIYLYYSDLNNIFDNQFENNQINIDDQGDDNKIDAPKPEEIFRLLFIGVVCIISSIILYKKFPKWKLIFRNQYELRKYQKKRKIQSQNLKKEQVLFKKFGAILKSTQKIKIHRLAKLLGISDSKLGSYLQIWQGKLKFTLLEESIVVSDIHIFLENLDAEFLEWESMEKQKLKKIR
jgi:parallel beta-helix repeat protein